MGRECAHPQRTCSRGQNRRLVDLLLFSCGWKREGSPRAVIASGCEPGLWLAVALGCLPPESEASGVLKKSNC